MSGTTNQKRTCQKCNSENVTFSDKRQAYMCVDCLHEFAIEMNISKRRIFLSYGHDEYATLAEQLKKDLQERGHEVWFDLDRLKPGGDWEIYIEEGIEWVSEFPGRGCCVLLMTPHSVRRPDGYCLNEIARALERNLPIIPIMAIWSEPPLSICRIQWLDMRDCVPLQDRRTQYEAKFQRLVEALEQNLLDFEGAQARLIQRLHPLEFDADIIRHLARFTGRQWLFDRIDEWLQDSHASRVFWIIGNPGVGKTAIAAWLLTHRCEAAAYHLCQHGHKDKANSRKTILSIAYQLSSQLPDYQERLNGLNLDEIVTQDNAKTLFDNLIVQPLSHNCPHPGRTIIILIDALDEATEGGRNELADFIGSEFDKTPEWIRLIITSRPEPEVSHPLQALTPYILDASTPENEDDIRTFLQKELVPFAGCKEPSIDIIDTIISLSEGVFLYVEWIRKELELGRLSLDRLNEFPKGLGGIYAQFFKRQFPDTDIFEKKYRSVLEIIVVAREPLGLDYISSIFNWSDYEQAKITDALGSLFPVFANKIQPFHKSVLDWLTELDKAGPYFISKQEGHKCLADYGWQEYQSGIDSMSGYSVVHLPAHLSLLGRKGNLHKLLLDFNWLQAKLEVTDITSLVSDYNQLPDDPVLKLVQGALRLSAHVLTWDKKQMAGQLLGRLQIFKETEIQSMLEHARKSKSGTWLHPLTTSLTPPGGPLMRTLEGHSYPVNSVAVTSDGRFAISASYDKTLKIWNMETGEQLRTLEGHTEAIRAVAVTPDDQRVISAACDRTLKIWDIKTGMQLRTLEGHTEAIRAVVVTPDGQRVISAACDKTLKIWDIETGEQLHTLEGHTEWVNAVAVTPDGRFVISASYDKTLKIWDIETGKQLRTLEGHTEAITALAVTPDDECLISASIDRTLKVWDIKTWKQLSTLEGHTDCIWAVAVTPNCRHAISASIDRTLKVWDIKTGKELRTLPGHTDWVTAVAVSPDNSYAISASYDRTLKIWDVETMEQLPTLEGHIDSVRGMAVTHDCQRAISGSGDKTLKVWDLKTGKQLSTMEGHTEWVRAAAVTPDDMYAISASSDKTLKVWNMKTGKELHTLKGHTDWVNAVAVTPDERRAISASDDGTLKIWDMETGKDLFTLEGHDDWVTAVAVISNSERAISGSKDCTLKVWDMKTGKDLFTLEGHDDWIWAVAVTLDGERVISGSKDCTLKVWDMKTREQLCTLKSHTEEIRAVAVTPDGRRAISASVDKTLKVWDLETGVIVTGFSGDSPLKSCAISSDGLIIVAGEDLGRVHFLRLEENDDNLQLSTK